MVVVPTRDDPTSPAQEQQIALLTALFKSYGDFPQDFHLPGPNYIVPDRGSTLIGVGIFFMLLAIFIASTRIFLRARLENLRLGTDDWTIIPSTVLAFVLTVLQIVGAQNGGLGRHVYDNTYAEIKTSLGIIYSSTLLYFFTVTCTKISLLLFVRRLTSGTAPLLRWILYGLMSFHVILLFIAVVVFGAECSPREAAWDLDVLVQKKQCINTTTAMIFFNIIFLFSDIIVMAMPIWIVWQLRLPRKSRLAIDGLFASGTFACICSIAKTAYYGKYYNSYDFTCKRSQFGR
jgi:hypothetical protein